MISTPEWYRPNDPLRTPTFAARALGVTSQTIRNWMRKGVVTFVEVGPFKKKRIYESEVARQLRIVDAARECSTTHS